MKQILTRLLDVAQEENREVFLVGGFIRDSMLGRNSLDVDMAVGGESEQFAKRVAWRLGGDYEPLDTQAGYHRVTVTQSDGKAVYLDFSALGEKRIADDLAGRDFTMNAMAVKLADYLSAGGWEDKIIDPCGGKADLQRGVLRAVSEKSLAEDPVRLLRPFKFLLKLDLQLDEETAGFIKKHGAQIKKAGKFRLATELFSLLETPGCSQGLHMLYDLDLLRHLTGETKMWHPKQDESHPVLHGLKTCRRLEQLLSESGPFSPRELERLKKHLSRPVEERRSRMGYLLLACLFHDIGKTMPRAAYGKSGSFSHEQAGDDFVRQLAARLRLSGGEYSFLSRLICNHSRPKYLRTGDHGLAGRTRFFCQFRDTAPELILLAMANSAANDKPDEEKHLHTILDMYFSGLPETLPEPLVNAADVIEAFNLAPNRRLGAILEEAYAAQLKGSVKSRNEALALVSVLLNER